MPVHGWGGSELEASEKDVGGEWLPENTLAEYSCEAGYRLQTSLPPRLAHHLTCRHGEWQGEVPQCGEYWMGKVGTRVEGEEGDKGHGGVKSAHGTVRRRKDVVDK